MKKILFNVLSLFNKEELKSLIPNKKYSEVEEELKNLNLDGMSVYYRASETKGTPFLGFVCIKKDSIVAAYEFESKRHGTEANIFVFKKDKNKDFIVNIDLINEYLSNVDN